MAGNPLASLPGLPQRPSLARSSASETTLTQPGIEAARSRKLNSAPTAAFRLNDPIEAGRQILGAIAQKPRRLDHAAAGRRGGLLILAGEIGFADRVSDLLERREGFPLGAQRLAGPAVEI